MSPHTVTFFTCRIPFLPRWSLASQVDTALSFLHRVPLLIPYMLHVSVAFRIWLLGRLKG
jgi:hypothetical protein